MASETSSRRAGRRSRRKLLLFCEHVIAQERFQHLLRHAGFQIEITTQLKLHDRDVETTDSDPVALAVLDSNGSEAALNFVRKLRADRPQLPLLVLLPELEDRVVFALLRQGVKGVLAYERASRELSRAALQVAENGYWVPSELLTRFVASILPELRGSKSLGKEVVISPREREVLNLLLENLSNKEIAGKLFVAERTVKFHVSNLLSKFHVQRRADLIMLWMQRPQISQWSTRELGRPLSAHVN